MAKKQTANQFGPTTGTTTTETKAPGDEKAASKLTKTGKVRKPRGPRQIDSRIAALKNAHALALVEIEEKQAKELEALKTSIAKEAADAKAASKAQDLVAKLTPAEQQAVLDKIKASMLEPDAIPEGGEGKAA
jgi:hypothetical protein